ncbi:unnamed protein product, partial [Ectocarpus sp. 4 AP-2014]
MPWCCSSERASPWVAFLSHCGLSHWRPCLPSLNSVDNVSHPPRLTPSHPNSPTLSVSMIVIPQPRGCGVLSCRKDWRDIEEKRHLSAHYPRGIITPALEPAMFSCCYP